MRRCRLSVLAVGLAFGAWSHAGSAAAVSYVAEFAATWSTATHPGAYPAGAHFSPLVGGVHSDQVSFWAPGGLASPGIEQMAEVGGVSLLRGEVESAIAGGKAAAVLQGPGVASPGMATVAIDVSAEFPLVTLVTMVAPTPDWFVGVHSLDLRDGAGWKSSVSVDLFAYDAGTEYGAGFSLSNPASTPQQPIQLLAAPLGPADPRLAVLTFTLVPAADFNGDLAVDGEDLATWRGGFGATGTGTTTQGDADLDGDVDGADFLAWQRWLESTSSRVAAVSAPEPAADAMLAVGMLALALLRRVVQQRLVTM